MCCKLDAAFVVVASSISLFSQSASTFELSHLKIVRPFSWFSLLIWIIQNICVFFRNSQKHTHDSFKLRWRIFGWNYAIPVETIILWRGADWLSWLKVTFRLSRVALKTHLTVRPHMARTLHQLKSPKMGFVIHSFNHFSRLASI